MGNSASNPERPGLSNIGLDIQDRSSSQAIMPRALAVSETGPNDVDTATTLANSVLAPAYLASLELGKQSRILLRRVNIVHALSKAAARNSSRKSDTSTSATTTANLVSVSQRLASRGEPTMQALGIRQENLSHPMAASMPKLEDTGTASIRDLDHRMLRPDVVGVMKDSTVTTVFVATSTPTPTTASPKPTTFHCWRLLPFPLRIEIIQHNLQVFHPISSNVGSAHAKRVLLPLLLTSRQMLHLALPIYQKNIHSFHYPMLAFMAESVPVFVHPKPMGLQYLTRLELCLKMDWNARTGLPWHVEDVLMEREREVSSSTCPVSSEEPTEPRIVRSSGAMNLLFRRKQLRLTQEDGTLIPTTGKEVVLYDPRAKRTAWQHALPALVIFRIELDFSGLGYELCVRNHKPEHRQKAIRGFRAAMRKVDTMVTAERLTITVKGIGCGGVRTACQRRTSNTPQGMIQWPMQIKPTIGGAACVDRCACVVLRAVQAAFWG